MPFLLLLLSASHHSAPDDCLICLKIHQALKKEFYQHVKTTRSLLLLPPTSQLSEFSKEAKKRKRILIEIDFSKMNNIELFMLK